MHDSARTAGASRRPPAGIVAAATLQVAPLPAGRRRVPSRLAILLGLAAVMMRAEAATPAAPPPSPTGVPAPGRTSSAAPVYEERTPSPDGTGRFYLGREIALVMGHQGAPWLERPERMDEERPDMLHQLLALQPGMAVADIGAGTGYHSWRMAEKVGPAGRVYAVDIQPEMLSLLATNMARRGLTNVQGVLGTTSDPRLPADSLDLVLLVDVYHEFDQPYEMLGAITRALKPGGRVAFVEFRGEQASVPIKRLHKMTEAQVRREAEVHPLEWIETRRELPWQHLVLFRKRPPASP